MTPATILPDRSGVGLQRRRTSALARHTGSLAEASCTSWRVTREHMRTRQDVATLPWPVWGAGDWGEGATDTHQ